MTDLEYDRLTEELAALEHDTGRVDVYKRQTLDGKHSSVQRMVR